MEINGHITQYIMDRNGDALIQLIAEGSYDLILSDIVKRGFSISTAKTIIATLKAITPVPQNSIEIEKAKLALKNGNSNSNVIFYKDEKKEIIDDELTEIHLPEGKWLLIDVYDGAYSSVKKVNNKIIILEDAFDCSKIVDLDDNSNIHKSLDEQKFENEVLKLISKDEYDMFLALNENDDVFPLVIQESICSFKFDLSDLKDIKVVKVPNIFIDDYIDFLLL